MNIIVLLDPRRKSFRLCLNAWALGAVAFCALAGIAAVFEAGADYGAKRSAGYVAALRDQTAALLEDELHTQRADLAKVKLSAEQSLDALASRVSRLQGHVMRLDALGSRLASMAKLDDMEFGYNNPPGMGGPETDFNQGSIGVGDFLAMLDQLEGALQDKEEKLGAMESMLIRRTLQEQTLPDREPAQNSWISSLYGTRTDPITGRLEFHQGMDFAGREGSPITAVAAGIVTWSGPREGYGNMVEISHGNGYMTRYGHAEKNLVGVGEKVEKGQIIALMGDSGRSTGTHVHFEVVKDGKHVDPRQQLSLK